jgi:hypothetical protein
MKRFAAAVFGLGLMALAGSATAQTADRSFEARYAVFARGVEAGDFNFSFRQTGATYEASATREMKGLVGSLLNRSQDYTYSVSGAVATDGALRPAVYQHQGGRRREDRPNGRLIRATFTANDVVTTSTPAGMGMGNPPATPEQRRNTVDQITALASMVTSSTDPCTRTIRVYMDGRSRFDFVLTPNGRVNVNTRAYRGEALRCRVLFRPIAGFGDPQEEQTLTFLFAPTPSGLYAPISVEMPVDDDSIRVARLEAHRIIINGARLR